jgi:sugar porter (SP) family MFS transporter
MSKDKSLSWAVTVALSGFLFGFDTVVISGANLPIKELWETGPIFHGFFIMSMALWGTVVGALLGGIPCDRFGRKKTLFWIGILYAVSAFGSAMSPDPYTFSFFRFIGGLGVGASSIAAPMYISEIAPPAKRGRLVAMYQFMLVSGILVAFISNYLLEGFGGDSDWRYMLGIEGIPALLYTIAVLGVPNSPRWLILKKNDEQGARAVMQQLGIEDVSAVVDSIERSVITARENFFSGKYSKPILLAFFLAAFNQLSGINFILYYAPEILELSGLASKESLFNSIAIGGVNFIFTYVGLYFIDRLGRKTLLIIGSIGYIIGLSMVSYSFYSGASPTFMLVFLLLFIASHAVGQGAIIWVYISEIFPNKVRAMGQSFGCGTHWVFAALITLFSPKVIDLFKENPWPIFAIFAAFMVAQLIFALFYFPETKGKSLEELEILSE